MAQQLIEASNLGYVLPSGRALFAGASFSVGRERVGLVGPNGVGKSTLLRILAGETQPSEGWAHCYGRVGYMRQDAFAGAREAVAALLDDDSEFGAHALTTRLAEVGMGGVDLSASASTLSGGELTRLAVARALASADSILLLDEPTNNLDESAKAVVAQILASWRGAALIVSHDRGLLSGMDRILELNRGGIVAYGGGYELYHQQRDLACAARERHLESAEAAQNAARRAAQQQQERQQKRAASGSVRARRVGASRLEIGAAKDRATASAKRNAGSVDARLQRAQDRLSEALSGREVRARQSYAIESAVRQKSGVIVSASAFAFAYPGSEPLFEPISFSLPQRGRMAVVGANGAGKSSLLRAIAGRALADSREIISKARQVAYLDQDFSSILSAEVSVLENFQRHSPGLSQGECRARLAQFLFRAEEALKPVRVLSGGEKLRAALACVLGAELPPDLVLLDEPTNNLDLDSIEHLESALSAYDGAIIAVSHDPQFLQAIGCENRLELVPWSK